MFFAHSLSMDETKMRQALAEYTQNDNLLDMKRKAYLPPVGYSVSPFAIEISFCDFSCEPSIVGAAASRCTSSAT